jgi:transposase
MMGSPRLKALELGEAERAALEALAVRRRTAQGLALRARIVLACAEMGSPRLVGARLAVHPDTVRKWRHRFAEHRLDGLRDDPRSGAPRKIGDERIEAVISRTLESLPADGTHWSSRGMAKASGLSTATVQRIWRAFGLQPHRVETFKLSTDPDFVAKVRDVVGLYMAPPDGSSANVTPGTERPSSVAFSTRSKRTSPPMSTFISSWTTMLPTRRRPSATGWSSDRTGTSTTHLPVHPGSTKWSASSPC